MSAAAQSGGCALADARWGLRLTKWSSRLANCAALEAASGLKSQVSVSQSRRQSGRSGLHHLNAQTL